MMTRLMTLLNSPARNGSSPERAVSAWESRLVLDRGKLVFGNTQLAQEVNDRLGLMRTGRTQQELDGLRERGELSHEGGAHDKHDHSQGARHQEIGKDDCQRPFEVAL